MGNVKVFHNWSTFSTAHCLSNMPKSMTLNVRQLQQAYHEIGFLQGTFSRLLAVVASALSVASILPSLTALVFFGFVQAGTVVFRAVRFAFT